MRRTFHRGCMSVAVMSLLVFAGSAQAGAAGQQLLGAAQAAVENAGKYSDFTTILSGANVGAMAYVNVKIYVMRRDIATKSALGEIDEATAGEQMIRLTNIQNDLERAKNSDMYKERKPNGGEPFFGIFTSNVPLSPLPPSCTLTLVPSTAVSYLRNPEIWGLGTSNPTEQGAVIQIASTAGGYSLVHMSEVSGPFPINGISSGMNYTNPRPSVLPGPILLTAPVSPTMLEFEAHFEGELTNDLYPASNPIVFLADVQGYIDTVSNSVWICTTEPMIVPGAPGQPPMDNFGEMDIGTRAVYDAIAQTLSFRENTDINLLPDVTLVRDQNGNHYSHLVSPEPTIGATASIASITYLGMDLAGVHRFSDAAFSISDPNGTYASGMFTNIHLDPVTMDFLATPLFVASELDLSSPFLDRWKALENAEVIFMSRVGAADLLAGSADFTTGWVCESNWVCLVPEPATVMLLAVGVAAMLKRRR